MIIIIIYPLVDYSSYFSTSSYFFNFIGFLNPLFFPNSFLYFLYCFFGTLITAFLWIPLIAFFPTFLSTVDLIVMDFKFLHPLKALSSIVCTFLPIVSFFSFLPLYKTFFLIDTTLHFTPLIVM